MSNATGNATSLNDLFEAVMKRIESCGENPKDYNVIGIMDAVVGHGVPVEEIDDANWWPLMAGRAMEDETGLPCPGWCRYGTGHGFESETWDGLQVRYHAMQITTEPRGVDVSIVQEETRPKGDDSGFARGTPYVWLTAEVDDLDATTARQIAASLTSAADELDRITGQATQ